MTKQLPPYPVRFSEDMRSYLEEQAEKNRRSFHSEILYRISRSIEQDRADELFVHNDEQAPELLKHLEAIHRGQDALKKLLTDPDFAARFVKDGLAGLSK